MIGLVGTEVWRLYKLAQLWTEWGEACASGNYARLINVEDELRTIGVKAFPECNAPAASSTSTAPATLPPPSAITARGLCPPGLVWSPAALQCVYGAEVTATAEGWPWWLYAALVGAAGLAAYAVVR